MCRFKSLHMDFTVARRTGFEPTASDSSGQQKSSVFKQKSIFDTVHIGTQTFFIADKNSWPDEKLLAFRQAAVFQTVPLCQLPTIRLAPQ